MIIKRESFKTWAELKKKALKYEQLGFKCEVRGWADISNNILTVSDQVHGHWISDKDVFDCSNCGETVMIVSSQCPFCGAIMDGKEETGGKQ